MFHTKHLSLDTICMYVCVSSICSRLCHTNLRFVSTRSNFFCNNIFFFAYVLANLHFMNSKARGWRGGGGGSNCGWPIRQFAHMPFGQTRSQLIACEMSLHYLLLLQSSIFVFSVFCSFFFSLGFGTLIRSVHKLMQFRPLF